ncbi:FAD-binding protein [Nocardia sp. GCM10030253]|uniref:FAD-binding protein n=1 Tax=Nocardia sp. GCM10030253 TaxID=3273404 RepID=UPI003644AD80
MGSPERRPVGTELDADEPEWDETAEVIVRGTELPELIGDQLRWDETADVIVVGFGIAGSCAAISAAEAGARVLILERNSAAGGASALAAGHFYLGGGTPVQRATGYDDSVEAMAAYLEAVTPKPDPAKIDAYCRGSVAHFQWLEAHGVEFERSFYPGKAVVQPGTEGLMWTGNEKVWPYRDQAPPAPRGHKVNAPAERGGHRVMAALTERVRELGIAVRYETRVEQLVADPTGRIVGVRWRDGAAGGTVVLAAGGYVMNRDMVAAYTPRLAEHFLPLGVPSDDGLGIRLGQSAGAATAHMDGAFMTASFYPPADLLHGIIVNKAGRRFVAEDSYHGRTAAAVVAQPDSTAYLIVDTNHMVWPELPMVKFVDGWDTVDAMESALALPVGALRRTMSAYNAAAAEGHDPEFGKHPDWLTPLTEGPWGAFDLTPAKATYVGFTLGGLATSVDGQVLRADGSPIGGLYAAGACASNIAQDSSGYSSGTCLGEGSYFGRRAGLHAAHGTRPSTPPAEQADVPHTSAPKDL